jgi:hypothetical protein
VRVLLLTLLCSFRCSHINSRRKPCGRRASVALSHIYGFSEMIQRVSGVPVHYLRHADNGQALPAIADLFVIAIQDVHHQRPRLLVQDLWICKCQPHDDVDSRKFRRLRICHNTFASFAVSVREALPIAACCDIRARGACVRSTYYVVCVFNGCSPYRLYSGPIIFCSCSLSSSWELGLSGYPRGLGSDFGG